MENGYSYDLPIQHVDSSWLCWMIREYLQLICPVCISWAHHGIWCLGYLTTLLPCAWKTPFSWVSHLIRMCPKPSLQTIVYYDFVVGGNAMFISEIIIAGDHNFWGHMPSPSLVTSQTTHISLLLTVHSMICIYIYPIIMAAYIHITRFVYI